MYQILAVKSKCMYSVLFFYYLIFILFSKYATGNQPLLVTIRQHLAAPLTVSTM